MFKRATWFGIGAAAGATGVVWVQQKVRRQLDSMGPDHVVVAAGNQARRVGRQVSRTVADAVNEGRSAMRDKEDELVTRRDRRRPRPPAGRRLPGRGEPRWPGSNTSDRPTRPAGW